MAAHPAVANSVEIRRSVATLDVPNASQSAPMSPPRRACSRTNSHCGISSAAANALASSSMSRAGARGRLVDRRAPAEQRLLAGAVHHPVAELVADREAPARRPLARLLGVDPDLAAGGEQQPRERLAGRERRRAGRGAHVLDVADEQPEDGVGEVLDRHGQRLAVPDVAGRPREHLLGAFLDVAHASRL